MAEVDQAVDGTSNPPGLFLCNDCDANDCAGGYTMSDTNAHGVKAGGIPGGFTSMKGTRKEHGKRVLSCIDTAKKPDCNKAGVLHCAVRVSGYFFSR